MSTKIEWCDETWNPITGCTPVSEGCEHCYAARLAKRFPAIHGRAREEVDGMPGVPLPFDTIVLHADRLETPLHWRRPRKVFVCSMGDLFHSAVLVGWTEKVWSIVRRCPQHRFYVLTKRPSNVRSCPGPQNVAIGVSVENQRRAIRVLDLLGHPAAMRFVSIEPLLGPVDLTRILDDRFDALADVHGLDWVIAGCESGPGRRPADPDWFRALRDQCKAAGVPFFLKQMDVAGKVVHMPRLDGRVWSQRPEGW